MAAEATLQQPIPLFGPDFFVDPYPLYAWLREFDPIRWDETVDAWVVTRYADVAALLNDPRFIRGNPSDRDAALARRLADEGRPELLHVYRLVDSMMLFSDPPRHTRLRALANRAFTPRVVETMRPHIQDIVNGLLDDILPLGQFDAILDLASPLPVVVICELLGLPAEDRERFKHWSDDIVAFAARLGQGTEQAQKALPSTIEISDYIHATVARLREHPDDSLLSALVAAEENGNRLTDEELLANAVLLLMNGHETTTYQIGNGLLALLRHSAQLQSLRDDPLLMSGAVEEMLRYDGAVQMRGLRIAEDCAIDGMRLRRNETALLMIGAANRDPACFPDPDRFDIFRSGVRHLDFGHGIHYCIAAALARAEIQIAIGTVLRRIPDLRLETSALDWQTVPVFRGLTSLPLAFTA